MIIAAKIKMFLFALVFWGILMLETGASFTISASVTKTRTLDFPVNDIITLIQDLSVFSRNFPNMLSVTSLGENKSEWVYEIDPPMASRFSVSFILFKKTTGNELVTFESSKNDNNYFFCKAKFIQAGDERVIVTLNFKIRLTRENGSDIHFMAPILGEKYISKKMKTDLSDDTDIFLSRIIKELKKRNG